MAANPAETAEGEFRVPEDVEAEEAEQAARAAETELPAADLADDAADATPRRRFRRRDRTADDTAAPVDLSAIDLGTTPGPMVGAVALGVVAAPLLGVYAVLFITRYFLQPGVSPDITSSWTGEGIAGIVAAILAIAMLIVVARAAGGRGLPVFAGAQVVVLGTCVWLLTDTANGGRAVTIVVAACALIALVLTLLPVSRRWFAAHTADRAAD